MIGNDWDDILGEEFKKDYFNNLLTKIRIDRKTKQIFPQSADVFKALMLSSYAKTKVVILGQDPYHGANQANGLAFAVNPGVKFPPSLKNIIKELETDLNIKISSNPDFTLWANQGVLLLNTILTVEESKPASHSNLGWEILTDEIIKKLSLKEDPVVFVLWGSHALSKSKLIAQHHKIITSVHPSPLSAYRGFLGSKPFSKVNEYLKSNNINWEI